ncbi:4'-phosphopantetheinyl transferase family protein [Streptomyces olivaceus]|uniref:4'-phosphopantetheinyl transferase family protein n=1 Tax=Streptomyces olivaceus TaxID=47716 RepID=UPI00363287E9
MTTIEVSTDVVCAARRTHRVLADLSVAASDRAAVTGMPPWRAEEYLAARTLLRTLLAETGRPHDGPIAYREFGRPWIPGLPGVGISLSHSAGWVAAAVSPGRAVGVDVQAPVEVSAEVIARCCSAADAAGLAALPEDVRALEFAWVWSTQEACVKATGEGLGGLPWTVPVAPGQPGGSWNEVEWVALREHSAVPLSCAFTELGHERGETDDE